MELLLLAGKYIFVGLIYLFVFLVYRGLIRQGPPATEAAPRPAGPQLLRRERPAPRAPRPVPTAPAPSAMPAAMREALEEVSRPVPPPSAAVPAVVGSSAKAAQSRYVGPHLVVTQSQTPEVPAGREFPLLAAVTIGRTEVNSIAIPDHFVSIQHAIIFLQEGRRILRDRGSTNGTLLNGRRITADMVLRDRDEITLGTTVLRYVEQPSATS